jgi:hypothetical protein
MARAVSEKVWRPSLSFEIMSAWVIWPSESISAHAAQQVFGPVCSTAAPGISLMRGK